MPASPLQIALTGITGYAKSYLGTIEYTSPEQTVLKAVTAINRGDHEEKCRELENAGAEVFTDFSEMLAAWKNRIDLCILPVPIHLHLPMTLQAQAAGMNVLLEKPMAGSVEQARTLCEADNPEQRIAIGFQDMYRPSTHRIAAELKQGRIGNITGIKMLALWPRPHSYYTRNNWAGAVEVDGHIVRDSPINNATAHFVNLALFFAGVHLGEMAGIERIDADLFRARDIQSFDTAALRVKTDTGIDLHLYATHVCKEAETAKVIVEGENGSMTWNQGQAVIWNVEGAVEEVEIESMEETKNHMFQSVLDSLQNHSPFLCTPEMALSHVQLVENLHLHQEIKNFRSDLLVHEKAGNEHKIYLPSLADDLKRCLAESALPSELAMDWA